METLQIEFQPNIKAQLLEFLNSFSKNDLKIVEEEIEIVRDEVFLAHQKRLQKSLDDLKSGKAKLYDIDELDAMLEKTIAKYEN
jgi:TRAP-type C4-dicarboxylate transport system substrate-binding protein